VDDLQFPTAYVRLIAAVREGGWPYFVLKEKVDAYGNHFDNGLRIMVTLEVTKPTRSVFHQIMMARFLRRSGAASSAEHRRDTSGSVTSKPGFIPVITALTTVLFFGSGGEPRGTEVSLYAFDYRENRLEPSVICWQNGYWRRVAPDCNIFLSLFKLAPNRFQESDVGHWEMEEARTARTVKALARMQR
jgi:hypothetical protein